MRPAAPAAAAALAAAALLALPAGAGASTVAASASVLAPGTTPDAKLTFTASPAEANRVTLSAPAVAVGEVTVRDEGALLTPGAGCERIDDHTAVCSPRRAIGPTGPAPAEFSSVTADLGDRPDQASVEGALKSVALLGGAGGDTLTGGDGADTLDGGTGRDVLGGGAGDDVFAESDEATRDVIDGGTGRDRLDYTGRRRRVSVDLGRGRGADGDSVARIEDVAGGRAADRLTGNSHGNTLDGGPGNDSVLGGAGADQLIGGQGRDLLSGGSGRDTLDVATNDRQADRARCGSSTDVVRSPASQDRLARDCEWALVDGVLVHQPLRAQRSGVVELRLMVPKDQARFRGRVGIRLNGILATRPSRVLSLAPRAHATARVSLVGPALARVREMHGLSAEVVVNQSAFTTELRAPLAPPTGTGGTPS